MNKAPTLLLQVEQLAVTYNTTTAREARILDDISFNVEARNVVCVVGESGSGKTTILRAISGTLQLSAGRVHLNPPATAIRPIVSVLQYDAPLLPFRTVFQNACLGIELAGHESDKGDRAYAAAVALLRKLSLANHAGSLPGAISGGMRQRVAFVQAVVANPVLLLLDEPFAFQDRVNQAAMEEVVFQQVRRETPVGCVLVTHDLEAAAALATDVFVLGARPGRIVARLKSPDQMKELSPTDRRSHPGYDAWADTVWHEVRHARYA